ncbi:MAG: InlB B-repeat-containing protein, partial [Spirochaetales bacterium]|nr:InlB B-repeat-containing protein [Spirochaetales bacterium]
STTDDSSSAELVTAVTARYNLSNDGMCTTDNILLTQSGTYYFWVRADNYYNVFKYEDSLTPKPSASTSDFSASANIEFTYQRLQPPTEVTAKQSTYSMNKVDISWKTNGSAYYWIYYSKTNDSNAAVMVNEDYDDYWHEESMTQSVTLSESGTYYFWVRSDSDYDRAGSDADGRTIYKPTSEVSDFSAAASCEFTYTPLTAPTGVTVTKGVGNRVSVKWTATDAACYWIYYGKTNNSANATCETRYAYSWAATEGYQITLTESGTYYFWVKSADGDSKTSNTSAFSEAASFDFTYTPLTAVTNVKAEQITPTLVRVSWTPNTAAYYGIYISQTNDIQTATYSDYRNSGDGYKTIRMSEDGTYYFWVAATDDRDVFWSGSTDGIAFSQSVSVAYQYAPMAAPTNVKAECASTNYVRVSWTSTGAPYYWIYMSQTDNTADAVYQSQRDGTAYSAGETVTSYYIPLNDYGTYYFWVKAAENYSPDEYSDPSRMGEYSDFSAAASYEHKAWTADLVDQIIFYNEDYHEDSRVSLTDGKYTVDLMEADADVEMMFAFGVSSNHGVVWQGDYASADLGTQNPTEVMIDGSYPFRFTFKAGCAYDIAYWVNEGQGYTIVGLTDSKNKVTYIDALHDNSWTAFLDGVSYADNPYSNWTSDEIESVTYTFDGWYTEDTFENMYYFNETVSGAVTLYAKWTAQ